MAMKIHWTPWFNVPIHRRLELFSVGVLMFCAFGLIPLTLSIILYIAYAGNVYLRAVCALYLAFIYYDRHTADRGGRGIGLEWFRGARCWKHCLNYFPVDLVKTADLPADKNYLVCFFPHGILSFGAALTFNTSHSKWSSSFPGVRPKATTLGMNLLFPIAREILLNVGVCSASANSLTTLLTRSNDPNDESNNDGYTSNAAALVVGGAEESFYAYPDTYKCVLKNRKGFVKIALKTGASLVPAISFGENNVYDLVQYKPGSKGWFFQRTFKQYTKVAPIFFNGRGFMQYNFGLIPKRHPITTVIGAPIHLEKNPNPTNEDVNRVHQIFCSKLNELFEAHKSKYVNNSANVYLELV